MVNTFEIWLKMYEFSDKMVFEIVIARKRS